MDSTLYASQSYANDVILGARTVKFSSEKTMRTILPDTVKAGPAFDVDSGYINLDSGWAFATRGIEVLMARVVALGGKIMGGKAVTGLIRQDGKTSGVILADGSCINASLVVIATGSWTASTFRELDLEDNKFLATG